ncbi:hypothetical protein D3C77_225600 [compost metagenome]
MSAARHEQSIQVLGEASLTVRGRTTARQGYPIKSAEVPSVGPAKKKPRNARLSSFQGIINSADQGFRLQARYSHSLLIDRRYVPGKASAVIRYILVDKGHCPDGYIVADA